MRVAGHRSADADHRVRDLEQKHRDATAGGSTTLTFDLNGDVDNFVVRPSDPARAGEVSMGDLECALLDPPNGTQRRCHILYRNLHGAGSVSVDVVAYGRCNGPDPASASLTLTVTP